MRAFWLALGLGALALGAVGMFVPLLPTVPFLLLSAFGFARSSERLHHWILSHRIFGPPISDWRERGVISRRAKYAATVSVLASLAASLALRFDPLLIVVQAAALGLVALFLWTRPNA
jgi:uncharacterized membrane protein YbaN (DUF454 family)